jgi:hypothetical protein
MELQYTVRGGDGKEYGPANLEQITEWIGEGRLPAQQQIRRSDMQHWAAAGDFLELQPVYASRAASVPAAAPATTSPQPHQQAPDAAQIKSNAAWFHWIAGLSLINSIAAFSGGSWRFFIGLGVTQLLDDFGRSLQGGGKLIVLFLDLAAAALFVAFGVFAQKGHQWAFIVGMVLFLLDGLVFLLVQDWLGVGFHVFVLYCLFRGLMACRASRG